MKSHIGTKSYFTKKYTIDSRAGQFFLDLEITFTEVRYDQNEPPRLGPASFGSNLVLLRGPTWAQISGNKNSNFTIKNYRIQKLR